MNKLTIKQEIWKDIPGHEGWYQGSNKGQVKRVNTGLVLKPQQTKNGYLIVTLSNKNNKQFKTVHSLVASAFLNHSTNSRKIVVNHINFTRTDNRVENLEIITQRENTNKKHIKSTSQYVGVSWVKQYKKWRSAISINGRSLSLGRFDNEIDASKAYEQALNAHNSGVKLVPKDIKGYYFDAKANKWKSQIQNKGKMKHLGFFVNERDAKKAYEEAVIFIKSGGEYRNKQVKGYTFDRNWNKWRSSIMINKKRINIGAFDTEYQAAKAYNDFINKKELQQ